MAARLPAGARIVATDLNQPMLDYAKAGHSGADRDRIEWKQADAQALPFRNQSFDVVACQFGVMFFPDKVQGYKEARRVLKPGGLSYLQSGTRSRKTISPILSRRLSLPFFPTTLPGFSPAPRNGYHDENQIRSDLRAAGFANAIVDVVPATSKALRAAP